MERARREERGKEERSGEKRKRERGKGKDCGLGDVRDFWRGTAPAPSIDDGITVLRKN